MQTPLGALIGEPDGPQTGAGPTLQSGLGNIPATIRTQLENTVICLQNRTNSTVDGILLCTQEIMIVCDLHSGGKPWNFRSLAFAVVSVNT